ncbi:uncharacterized protein LOC123922227 [Trifolium pratense]|uniref:uncharacterized protein LOC123922227 n=1 Tax=Trifolium pratense TaxID=57577 RepID=UPI001E696B00|nr:uncharacterized protein LOC123922227 [Trifolium pratense]
MGAESIQSRYSGDQRNFARRGFLFSSRHDSRKRRCKSRSPSVHDRRLNFRGGEESKRCHDRSDFFDRSKSVCRRRRLDFDGDRRTVEVGKGFDCVQQNGVSKEDRLAQFEHGGGRIEVGKDTVGSVKEGSDKIKEVGNGVIAGSKDIVSGSNLKRYVSFYFTNFPAQLPKFYLRKGFEVCGILEDVYVAKKRNKFGQPYGFVKYFNVKNVSKMTNALNNVWFGNFRVKASVAMFERNFSRVDRKMESHKVVKEQVGAPLLQEGKQESLKLQDSNINEEGIKLPERLPQREEVRVGEIVVELGARKINLTHQIAHKEGFVPPPEKDVTQAATVKECRRFRKSYRSKNADVMWASSGVVATIINGEAVPLVQDRILDAGFKDLVLIPMGADKVFLRCLAGGDVMRTVINAKEFFQLFFSNWTRWETDMQPYRRGAWVRLYGIPLHAWNVEFFKLCVLDCGRFLRTDGCSVEKDKLDFARVLIATPNLDIINSVESILVDGGQVDVKIVEEWGYALGEDYCLVEEERGSEAVQSECGEGHVDPEVSRDVDLLINNITEGLEDAACIDVQSQREEESLVKQKAGESERRLVQRSDSPRSGSINDEIFSKVRPNSQVSGVRQDKPSVVVEAQVHSPVRTVRVKRTNSCPPEVKRSVISGPWSLEWLNDQNHGDVGVGDDVNRSCTVSRQVPSGESSSSGSINNDWTNWVAVQGNDHMAVDDVWGIGKAIGLKFKGDNVNMFNILSRAGKGKKENSGRGSVGGPRSEHGR